jgi:hypothetical protein
MSTRKEPSNRHLWATVSRRGFLALSREAQSLSGRANNGQRILGLLNYNIPLYERIADTVLGAEREDGDRTAEATGDAVEDKHVDAADEVSCWRESNRKACDSLNRLLEEAKGKTESSTEDEKPLVPRAGTVVGQEASLCAEQTKE